MSATVELRRTRTWAACARAIAALLLLASIGADLASDTHCDPGFVAHAGSALAVADSADACADGCVADCYCCSAVSLTPHFRLAAAVCRCEALVARADTVAAAGVPHIPYRPPLDAPLS